MTQKHIRDGANLSWYRRAYHRLHEPRLVSAVYGGIYLMAFIVAIYNFIEPPRTIIEAADNPLLLWIALASMTAGGALGVFTVGAGNYWLERYAVALLAGGLTIYWIISAWLTFFSGGSRWMSLMTTTMAVILVALRSYWVMDRPFNPRRRT